MRPFLTACAIAALALPALAVAAPASTTVELKGPKGEALGTATLIEGPKGVLLKIDAKGLTPGWHGLHFHEKGDCSSADFKSAGGHVHGGTSMVHGLLNPDINEAGDLTNLYVGADGTGHAEILSPWISLMGSGERLALMDRDGSALVIHAKPDDYTSQPIGGAGDRVACGVIMGA
jgi:Cu-Zn family superoxide dismutase